MHRECSDVLLRLSGTPSWSPLWSSSTFRSVLIVSRRNVKKSLVFVIVVIIGGGDGGGQSANTILHQRKSFAGEIAPARCAALGGRFRLGLRPLCITCNCTRRLHLAQNIFRAWRLANPNIPRLYFVTIISLYVLQCAQSNVRERTSKGFRVSGRAIVRIDTFRAI